MTQSKQKYQHYYSSAMPSIKGELVFPVQQTLPPEEPHHKLVLDYTDAVSARINKGL